MRRSIRIAPGIRLNLGKRGVSASFGVRAAHETIHISGRRTTSIGIPGSGISYVSRSGGTRQRRPRAQLADVALASLDPASFLARPGLLASSAEKRYHEGVLAFLHNDRARARVLFEQVLADAPQVASAQLLAAMCALDGGDKDSAMAHLEAVVQAPIALPDAFAARYLPESRIRASLQISVTDLVHAIVPANRAGAVLALAEQYQEDGRLDEAVGLVQQLHAAEPDDPVVRLSLADLLADEGDFEGVLEVAAPAHNVDNINLATIHLRARAFLELGHRVAAFETYRLALARTAGRDITLLKAIRYDRARAYEETGQSAKSRDDLERLYALDPTYRDVKARLDATVSPASADESPAGANSA